MINYWNNLSIRDRWAALIGSASLLVYLFYLLVYSPLNNAVSEKSSQLLDKQETLQWMQQIKKQPLESTPKQTINNGKLLSLVAAQLAQGHLKKFVYQLQQTGSGEIQLNFEAVPYSLFLSWLWTLNNNYNLRIKQFSCERSQTPGVVKLSVTISAQ